MSATEEFVSVPLKGEPVGGEVGGDSDEASSAPARSRAATRQRILEAGTALFARDGVHAVTSARIAKAAGVAAGTFYLHFEDKKELFREIVFAAVARLQQAQAQAAEAAGPDVRAQVRARIAELAAFTEQNRHLITLVFGRNHEAASLDEDILESFRPRVEEALRGRVENGDLRGVSVAVASQALMGMQSRVIAWWAEDPTRATRSEVIETLCLMHPLLRPSGGDSGGKHV
jgi:AcrR family transcriptional regulator